MPKFKISTVRTVREWHIAVVEADSVEDAIERYLDHGAKTSFTDDIVDVTDPVAVQVGDDDTLESVVERDGRWEPYECVDCPENTHHIREYYMVHDAIWASAGMGPNSGMLCIGCLENRIDRTLGPEDFIDAPLNLLSEAWNTRSPRLQNRLGFTTAPESVA